MRALETGNASYALIWVQKKDEAELTAAFDRAKKARIASNDAREVADDWFFETAVRLHRAGEGAAYTGLKPAGLDEGPVVPKAEKAIETGDPKEAIGFLLKEVEDDLQRRFQNVLEKKNYNDNDVASGRQYVAAFINFVVWSHHLYAYIKGGGEHGHAPGPGKAEESH